MTHSTSSPICFGRPSAFTATVCGKPSKRKASGGRKSRKTRENDALNLSAADNQKLKKGCVIVAGILLLLVLVHVNLAS